MVKIYYLSFDTIFLSKCNKDMRKTFYYFKEFDCENMLCKILKIDSKDFFYWITVERPELYGLFHACFQIQITKENESIHAWKTFMRSQEGYKQKMIKYERLGRVPKDPGRSN